MSAKHDSESEGDGGCSYKCDTCNRTFWGEYCIQKHVHVHTEQQVYTCNVCAKTFISAAILERHKTNKHSSVDANIVQRNHLRNTNEYVSEEMAAEDIEPNSYVKIECLVEGSVYFSEDDENIDNTLSVHDDNQYERIADQHEEKSRTLQPESNSRSEANQKNVRPENEPSCKSRLKWTNKLHKSNKNDKEQDFKKDLHVANVGNSGAQMDHSVGGDVNCIAASSVEIQDNNIVKTPESKIRKELFCSVCGISFRKKSEKWINAHYLDQHEIKKLHHCSICGFGFTYITNLGKHLRNVHKIYGDIQKPKSRCDFCNKLFADKGNLTEHMLVHIGNSQYSIRTCKICGKKFPNRSALRRHMNSHLSEEELRAGLTHKEKAYPWACKYCEKRFTHRFRMKEHVANMHTGDKSNVCSVCGKSYYLPYELKRHMFIHTGENIEKTSCPICDAKFTRPFTLNRHMKKHSEEPSRFECTICHKTFSRLWTLQRHEMTHNGTEPFLCAICGDKFIFKILLTEHMLDKHSPDSCQYTCHICDLSYNTERKLRVHLYRHDVEPSKGKLKVGPRPKRTHNSHLCETCGLKVKSPFDLKVHRQTHTEYRPYECPVCGKGFRILKTMETHLRLHTGDNFHSCTLCNKYYVRPIDLEYHLRGKIHARKLLKKEKRLQKDSSKIKKDY